MARNDVVFDGYVSREGKMM